MKAEMERVNKEVQSREKKVATTERTLKQRERDMEKQLQQAQTQKALIIGLENQVKELLATNKLLQQVIDASGVRAQHAENNSCANPQTGHTKEPKEEMQEEIRRLREEIKLRDMETRLTDRIHNMETRVTAQLTQKLNTPGQPQLIPMLHHNGNMLNQHTYPYGPLYRPHPIQNWTHPHVPVTGRVWRIPGNHNGGRINLVTSPGTQYCTRHLWQAIQQELVITHFFGEQLHPHKARAKRPPR